MSRIRHVAEKNGIYSNDYNSKSMQRNQKVFWEKKECLSSFHLSVLSMDFVMLSQRYRGLSLGIENIFCILTIKFRIYLEINQTIIFSYQYNEFLKFLLRAWPLFCFKKNIF